MTVQLYNGDCRELAPTLRYTAVISDPPYGMNWNPDSNRFTGGETNSKRGSKTIEHDRVIGDDVEFDPTPWVAAKRCVLFGANHFAAKLPVGTSLIWIKRNTAAFGTFLSDAEIAWMRGGHGVRCHLDMTMNGKGANLPNYHPTQKPVGLMRWVLQQAGVTKKDVVLDPYMGSGTTIIACMDLGIPCIGIEIDEKHYATAHRRVAEHCVQTDMLADAG